jgi:hypothetical protein
MASRRILHIIEVFGSRQWLSCSGATLRDSALRPVHPSGCGSRGTALEGLSYTCVPIPRHTLCQNSAHDTYSPSTYASARYGGARFAGQVGPCSSHRDAFETHLTGDTCAYAGGYKDGYTPHQVRDHVVGSSRSRWMLCLVQTCSGPSTALPAWDVTWGLGYVGTL